MAIVQEAFDIPANIMTGILSGEYRRVGGVVRYAVGPKKGRIVKHLTPVELKEAEAAKGFIHRVSKIAKANPKATILVSASAIIAGGGTIIYQKLKGREPAVLRQFRQALKQYLDAIRAGCLDTTVIDEMEEALQMIKLHPDYEKFSIKLNADDIETLVTMIQEYTIKLATDNNVEFEDATDKSDDAIIDFEKYLALQKRVFEEAV